MVKDRIKVNMIITELHHKAWNSYSTEDEKIADVYLELLRAKRCLEYALEDYFLIKFKGKSLEKLIEEYLYCIWSFRDLVYGTDLKDKKEFVAYLEELYNSDLD